MEGHTPGVNMDNELVARARGHLRPEPESKKKKKTCSKMEKHIWGDVK